MNKTPTTKGSQMTTQYKDHVTAAYQSALNNWSHEATDNFFFTAPRNGVNARNVLYFVTRSFNNAWVIESLDDQTNDIRVMHFNGDMVHVKSGNLFGLVTVEFIDGYTGQSDSIQFPDSFGSQVIAHMITAGFQSFAQIAKASRA
jgi:hypothetical protein